MKIIIPMAGVGQRFLDAGYSVPKPFIEVNGKMIVQYITEMFDPENDEFIFLYNSDHWHSDKYQSLSLKLKLRSLVKKSILLEVVPNSFGPVYSLLSSGALERIQDDEEVIVSYCDNPFLMDYQVFKDYLAAKKPDGAIFSHVGFHPHRLSSTYMAYMKLERQPWPSSTPRVVEIKEKEPYTDNHWSEHASTGTYYFRKGSYIKKYFQELFDKKLCHTNGEYYVTLAYNLLIKDNLFVASYPTDYVTVFGTPEELKNYEVWQTIISGSQVKSETDLLRCYNYWKKYNAVRDTSKTQ